MERDREGASVFGVEAEKGSICWGWSRCRSRARVLTKSKIPVRSAGSSSV
jgi:hypothetical protein